MCGLYQYLPLAESIGLDAANAMTTKINSNSIKNVNFILGYFGLDTVLLREDEKKTHWKNGLWK